jgi:hypothetical protein
MENRRTTDQELLTTEQAAEILGVNPRTVRRMIDRGSIRGAYKADPSSKSVLKIPAKEVERILKLRADVNSAL